MKRIGFVFPGQGSQSVGMGKDLYDNFDVAKDIYDRAVKCLSFDVKDMSFNGPKEEIDKTVNTQPLLLTASVAALEVLKEKGVTPRIAAGHSLGEYTALYAAGIIGFEDALMLTKMRATYMQEAVPAGKGLMAAILGLDRSAVDKACLSVTNGYVSVANYNCPRQVVIAGEKEAVYDAMKLAKAEGAKKTVALAVSVPSHCSLMIGASEKLAKYLDNLSLKTPEFPVVNNADAMVLSNAETIKASMIRQLNSPLLWEDSIATIVSSNINAIVEVGPGRVLSGLIRKIDSTVTVCNVEDVASLEKTLKEVM